jgi:energy-coupling factor transporter ATP-binding protein EcfA2
VVQYADRIVEVRRDGTVSDGPPAQAMRTSAVAPPVVALGRLAEWDPIPLSVRDARRKAGPLRQRLAGHEPPARRPTPAVARDERPSVVLRAKDVAVRYGSVWAVAGADLELEGGEVAALMGRNGSGKSSLLWALQGSGPRLRGTVDVDGDDPGTLSPAGARRLVGLVPQTPADLLYLDTVAEECQQADRESAGAPPGTACQLLDQLAPGVADEEHPRDLSEGQRLALVLAVQLAASPRVILLDEPTRGLDYGAKQTLAGILAELAAGGRAVVVATHDVEFVAEAADRVIVMAEGEIIADGPTAAVIAGSPAFAPQMAKILAPLEYLTTDQVERALTEGPT